MTQAIVLAGGKGTRLRPMTVNIPKPMLPVGGVPYLAHLMTRAAAAGVDRMVMRLGPGTRVEPGAPAAVRQAG
ncbi:sugar phosphate nucleotidyltransferase [Actinomadura sp. NPDC047616]|uniref:nucleotidyltransferase family protein n=1 Tax=Actinomadura sp. NPDC047616 TaxID=3155914 RepID=UPI0033FEAF7B